MLEEFPSVNAMNTKTRFLEKTRYYCDLGFFTEYHHLPDESIAMAIIGRQIELYQGGVADLFDWENDWKLLKLDSQRVIGITPQLLCGEIPPPYTLPVLMETLGALSKISRGQFMPENIIELGQESIGFNLNGKPYSLTPLDPLDEPLVLAGQINPTIAKTGYQFEVCDVPPSLYLVLLSPAEKQKLIHDKGWVFLPKRWAFFSD